jgi:hypothetical protein
MSVVLTTNTHTYQSFKLLKSVFLKKETPGIYIPRIYLFKNFLVAGTGFEPVTFGL